MKSTNDLFEYEKELLSKGIKHIAGVDEVGRGPLAGPIVIGAVILDIEFMINDISLEINEINDSKKLTERKREELSKFILNKALDYKIIEISNIEIDKLGIGKANAQGFYTAIQQLNLTPQHILTDHFKIKEIAPEIQTNITKGDSKSVSIAAASIIAKVYRDHLMVGMHNKYPQYGFDQHKGYGTKYHLDKIVEFGPCEIHRKSFEPVKSLVHFRREKDIS